MKNANALLSVIYKMGGVIFFLSVLVNPVLSQKEKHDDDFHEKQEKHEDDSYEKHEKYDDESCEKDKITGIELNPVCSEHPNELRRWSIYNPNPYWVYVHYRIDNSKIKGKIICPPAGMADPSFPGDTIYSYTFLITMTIPGDNTMSIKYAGGKHLQTSSLAEKCFVDEKWSLNGNETDENNFLGTRNNQNLQIKTNDSLRMVVGKTGDISIFENLDVNKKVSANNLQLKSFSGHTGELLLGVDSTGNVKTTSVPILVRNDTLIIENLRVSNQLMIGDSTLHLDATPGSAGENEIYSLGDLTIQSRYSNYNTILNAGTNYGNVGIGTNSPDYKLDVKGDINFTGSLLNNGNEIRLLESTISDGSNLLGGVEPDITNPYPNIVSFKYDLGEIYTVESIKIDWEDVAGTEGVSVIPSFSILISTKDEEFEYSSVYYHEGSCQSVHNYSDIELQGEKRLRYIKVYKIVNTQCNESELTNVSIHEKLQSTAMNNLSVQGEFNADPLFVVNGKVGINNNSPDYLFDVNGGANIEGDLHVNNRLFVEGDIYQKGKLLNFDGASLWEEKSGNLFTSKYVKIEKNVTGKWSRGLLIDITGDADDVNLTKSFQIHSNGIPVFSVWGNGIVNAQKIYAEAFEITPDALNIHWWDCVFNEEYPLMTIAEVDSFISVNKHLPDMPSEKEIKEKGVNLLDMDGLLLKKIEELTIYVIKQQKEIEFLKKELGVE